MTASPAQRVRIRSPGDELPPIAHRRDASPADLHTLCPARISASEFSIRLRIDEFRVVGLSSVSERSRRESDDSTSVGKFDSLVAAALWRRL
jgi:hypothetical protein